MVAIAAGTGNVGVEDAGEGLGQLLAVGGVGDEVAPGRGDALEAVDGPGGEAGEDLEDEVIGEQGQAGRWPRMAVQPRLGVPLQELPFLRLLHGRAWAGVRSADGERESRIRPRKIR